MDKNILIEKYKNNEVIQVAFTGEKILYEFIGEDNITYWVIKREDNSFDVEPAANISSPPLNTFVFKKIKSL